MGIPLLRAGLVGGAGAGAGYNRREDRSLEDGEAVSDLPQPDQPDKVAV